MEPLAARAVAEAIRGRRTCKAFTGAPIAREQLTSLLELARWAPTHRLTEPWRFYVLEQPAITRFSAFLRVDPAFSTTWADPRAAGKLEKLIGRLDQPGALVLTTWMRAEDLAIDREEHAAACAAVQNLLLATHAAGLAGYWSTAEALVGVPALRWCGADPDHEAAVGVIWLGHPASQPLPTSRRPLAERVRWLDEP